jgi:hypothetical protein
MVVQREHRHRFAARACETGRAQPTRQHARQVGPRGMRVPRVEHPAHAVAVPGFPDDAGIVGVEDHCAAAGLERPVQFRKRFVSSFT